MSFGNELGMQAQCGSDVPSLASHLMVSWPRLGRGGDGERINTCPVGVGDRGSHVREEIEVTMKIDKRNHLTDESTARQY
jgi:hypothetical protein